MMMMNILILLVLMMIVLIIMGFFFIDMAPFLKFKYSEDADQDDDQNHADLCDDNGGKCKIQVSRGCGPRKS